MMDALEDFGESLLAILKIFGGIMALLILYAWAITGLSPIEVFLK